MDGACWLQCFTTELDTNWPNHCRTLQIPESGYFLLGQLACAEEWSDFSSGGIQCSTLVMGGDRERRLGEADLTGQHSPLH